jgi:hypothetical protein
VVYLNVIQTSSLIDGEGGDGCVQAVQCRHRWWCAALQVQLAEPLAAEPLAAALQVPLAQVPLAAAGR